MRDKFLSCIRNIERHRFFENNHDSVDPERIAQLATELKRRLRWLNSPEEIQQILGRGTHTKVIEHLRPEFVTSLTSELEALGITYTVWDDEDAPKG